MSRIVERRNHVLVYTGEGASQRSVKSTIESLKNSLHGAQIRQVNRLDLLEGQWQNKCALLVLPGGADLPYCQYLNGLGNALIKEYVRGGGSYLGICAGAYYACRRIEFEPDTPLEVRGERELGFFPGLGKGAVQSGFDYQTEAGTAAVPIQFKDPRADGGWQSCRDYSNGGPAFIADDDAAASSHSVLARYDDDALEGSAAVACPVGKGLAVLCGTHPELGFRWLDPNCSSEYLHRLHPRKSIKEVRNLVTGSTKIRAALAADQEKREIFWKRLLVAAGMMDHIRWVKTPIELQSCRLKKQALQLDVLLGSSKMASQP